MKIQRFFNAISIWPKCTAEIFHTCSFMEIKSPPGVSPPTGICFLNCLRLWN